MITRTEMASLSELVRRVRGRCLQRGKALDMWFLENPQAKREEVRLVFSIIGRSHFPPIDAPHPKYPERPFFDARFETFWRDDE